MSKRSLARLGVAALSLAVIMPNMAPAQAAKEIKIGVITSSSGPLGSYGLAYNDGLEWGLNYYTGGKMSINGAKLVVTTKDDAADPASATASFKEMVGNGTKIIVGTASSGVALTLGPLAAQNKILYISGPAKNDLVTSAANKYVFRSGNSSTQDLAPLAGVKPIKGKKVILFVEDNAFGAGNIAAARALMGPKGALFEEIKVPTSTSDFTPFAKKAADANGTYIFIAWSNALTAGAMLTSLKVQGAFAKSRPITGLAGAATYNIYGTLFEGTNAIMTNSYFAGASKSQASNAMAAWFAVNKKTQDLFTSTGADAAKMIVRALTGNPSQDVDKMISNLEGYSWVGVKGFMTVNASNHLLIQPMFLVGLTKTATGYVPLLQKTISGVGK
ncbi:MAG: ABC transporter substrate-binding protein [Candidatus Planktophila sp.]|nr:ABC transporter substrate-binding protein [Candidatus Planktophila sp.]